MTQRSNHPMLESLQTRISLEEKQLIMEAARKSHMTITEFTRRAVVAAARLSVNEIALAADAMRRKAGQMPDWGDT